MTRIFLLILCFNLSLAVTKTYAANSEFVERPELLDQIFTEGATQRFYGRAIKALKNNLDNLTQLPNSWIDSTLFRIYEKNSNSFKFEGIQSGTFAEAPFCQPYQVRFSGEYNEITIPPNRTTPEPRVEKQWRVHSIQTDFIDRRQCL